MKLARLRIRNFRCYKKEIAFDFDDMTAFVGKNDVGKSTVMDALDIFLNEGAPDKNDATKDGKPLPTVADRSQPHDGTIVFELVGEPVVKLKGTYWTERKTTGEVVLTFREPMRLEEFPSDLGKHLVSGKE
jgi:predicted ATP-dependent endonuclease of OLD family